LRVFLYKKVLYTCISSDEKIIEKIIPENPRRLNFANISPLRSDGCGGTHLNLA
jgi:hypothetical protein